MMWAAWPITLALAAGVTVVVLILGRRLRALGRAVLIALSALVGAWLVGNRLTAEGWHDIDGWVDCSPSCNAWHLAGVLFFWAPPLVAFVLIVALSIAVVIDRGRPSHRS